MGAAAGASTQLIAELEIRKWRTPLNGFRRIRG
jgi:hypothetical protein